MTAKSRRLGFVMAGGLLLAAAVWLVTSALKDNIVFFFTPSELTAQHYEAKRLRIGGLVAENSVEIDGTLSLFTITDETATILVRYDGALPDLFREGQGVVAEGRFARSADAQDRYVFQADTVLAKHDENYMPREVAESLKEQGVWQGGDNTDNAGTDPKKGLINKGITKEE